MVADAPAANIAEQESLQELNHQEADDAAMTTTAGHEQRVSAVLDSPADHLVGHHKQAIHCGHCRIMNMSSTGGETVDGWKQLAACAASCGAAEYHRRQAEHQQRAGLELDGLRQSINMGTIHPAVLPVSAPAAVVAAAAADRSDSAALAAAGASEPQEPGLSHVDADDHAISDDSLEIADDDDDIDDAVAVPDDDHAVSHGDADNAAAAVGTSSTPDHPDAEILGPPHDTLGGTSTHGGNANHSSHGAPEDLSEYMDLDPGEAPKHVRTAVEYGHEPRPRAPPSDSAPVSLGLLRSAGFGRSISGGMSRTSGRLSKLWLILAKGPGQSTP